MGKQNDSFPFGSVVMTLFLVGFGYWLREPRPETDRIGVLIEFYLTPLAAVLVFGALALVVKMAYEWAVDTDKGKVWRNIRVLGATAALMLVMVMLFGAAGLIGR